MSKQEQAYTILRDRIHSGQYQSHDRLNIDGLSREFGVSAIPVREALRRLEAEGWVQFRPNVGAIVAPVESTSWEQAMVAVALLEGAASGRAQSNLRKSDFAKLRRVTAQMEQAIEENDVLRFSGLNRQFHEVITGRCQNLVLLDLLAQTNRRLDEMRRTMFVYLHERSRAALGEHLEMIRLLESGSEQQAEDYARWHKMQTVEAYRAVHERNHDKGSARTTRSRKRA